MLNAILNVLTGAIAHWNETNNKAINILSLRIDKLDIANIELFRKFIACSHITVNLLLGPSRKHFSLIKVRRSDVKNLSVNDFIIIYKGLLILHIKLFTTLSNHDLPAIKDCYKKNFNEDFLFEPTKSFNENDINDIVYQGISSSFSHLNFWVEPDPGRDFVLFTSITSTYKSVFIS